MLNRFVHLFEKKFCNESFNFKFFRDRHSKIAKVFNFLLFLQSKYLISSNLMLSVFNSLKCSMPSNDFILENLENSEKLILVTSLGMIEIELLPLVPINFI